MFFVMTVKSTYWCFHLILLNFQFITYKVIWTLLIYSSMLSPEICSLWNYDLKIWILSEKSILIKFKKISLDSPKRPVIMNMNNLMKCIIFWKIHRNIIIWQDLHARTIEILFSGPSDNNADQKLEHLYEKTRQNEYRQQLKFLTDYKNPMSQKQT